MNDDEFYQGYRDGFDLNSPEPSANRSHCYRHSFMVGRADRRGEAAYGSAAAAREMAAEAERNDAEAQYHRS